MVHIKGTFFSFQTSHSTDNFNIQTCGFMIVCLWSTTPRSILHALDQGYSWKFWSLSDKKTLTMPSRRTRKHTFTTPKDVKKVGDIYAKELVRKDALTHSQFLHKFKRSWAWLILEGCIRLSMEALCKLMKMLNLVDVCFEERCSSDARNRLIYRLRLQWSSGKVGIEHLPLVNSRWLPACSQNTHGTCCLQTSTAGTHGTWCLQTSTAGQSKAVNFFTPRRSSLPQKSWEIPCRWVHQSVEERAKPGRRETKWGTIMATKDLRDLFLA